MAQKSNVWDALAKKYDGLWVQKYSLAPTRRAVKHALVSYFDKANGILLDLGCGTGQLLCELSEASSGLTLLGIDKSAQMTRAAQAKETGATFFCLDIDEEELPGEIRDNALDVLVCCHSFPYYKDKPAVLAKLFKALKAGGILLFVQASTNNLYDRLVLCVVERTAEPANYLSRKDFRALVSPFFTVKHEFMVRERVFMPSICGFVLEKRL